MVRALDLQSRGRGFDSQLFCCPLTVLGRTFTFGEGGETARR